VLLLAIAACSAKDDDNNTRVPSNATLSLGVAVERLRDAGLRFEIAKFPAQPAGVGLEGYFVRYQTPRAPALVPRGSTIGVYINRSPIPSPGFRTDHPPTIVVPGIEGLSYSEAVARLPEGLWLQLGAVPPLPADASPKGFDAFVVARQLPKAGTVVPYGCALPPGGGCRVSTVRIDLRLAG
jgi:beta-lactam-binding protein with PASTA domain